MTQRFSASVAARHMACPASANLEIAIPNWQPPVVDPDKGAKGKGTAFHAMLEPIMKLTPREVEWFATAIDYVAQLRKTRRFNVLVEEGVTAQWLASAPGTTADLVLYVQDEIHVIDFKWGGIPVEVIDNKQLLFYAACYAPLAPKAKGVRVHIVQPPTDTYESWFADTNILAAFIADAVAAESKILALDTTFGPSDNCMFCPANPHSRGDKGRPFCPAMMGMLYPDHTDEDEILGLAIEEGT